ncbi:MAG: DUF1553 domain-containing protein [Planctomycetaceae bacterium]|nr:DUF1553 domain-containing protein [Planctomycetaceae bacterium]MBT6153257.1 DUF1553 domain-containing protein [Planctomycetaceae bacterium]MBT6486914.1 DUF1553 domain-containing protein [Planctomycetaceae bacterium]MBT6493598.1 DUF1553 domain-containing protein [Planctomycetaceae bacterium]
MNFSHCQIGRFFLACGLLACVSAGNALAADGATKPETNKIDFARDVAPIFAEHCNDCHGADAQEGRLRLDAKKIVFKGGLSGKTIIPGDSKKSLLLRRMLDGDEEERMPLDADPLSDKQIAVIRDWIDQGAVWPDGVGSDVESLETHWAYIKPVKPALPTFQKPGFSKKPGFSPANWIRNPIDAFVLSRLKKENISPSAEADKARLLRRVSLDLIGIPPSVEEVDAFLNDDRSDAYQRVVKRLLASPRYGERWARPWLDLARYADSNGFQADQYRDVWPFRDWVIQAMNADMPFDQFTIEQIAGDLLPGATLSQKIATGFHRQPTCNVEAGVDPEQNRVNQVIDRVNTTGTVWLGTSISCGQCHSHKYDPFTQRDYYRLFAYFNNTLIEVKHTSGTTYDFYGPKLSLPLTKEQEQKRAELTAKLAAVNAKLKPQLAEIAKLQTVWETEQTARIKNKQATGSAEAKETLPPGIVAILKLPAKKRKPKQKLLLHNQFLKSHPEVKKLSDRAAALQKQLAAVKPNTSLVMVEQEKPRDTHVFKRGNFLKPLAKVEAGTPGSLHAPVNLNKDAADAPQDRLGLARWLADKENPLVARVTVNRWWAEIFGRGIVRTEEDFGTQGDPPTHPEVLDWLAVEFMENGWSMKHIHELIVNSATYRQSSRVTPKLLERDPENRLLARGARFRLPAEMIRDNALQVSGLLSTKAGGPPVFPPQPPGVWRHVGRNAPKYVAATNEDRFRRGIYTIWRRSAPYASFVNFDAPDRAACVVKRPRTNTPLQSLTLLNDEAYLEMAMALAGQMAANVELTSDRDRVIHGFRRCFARQPTDFEADHLLAVYQRELKRYEEDPKTANKIIGKTKLPKGVSAAQLVAWFHVSHILMNLDEMITKG